MAKISAGTFLLFGVLADGDRVRKRKNGSYKMVFEDVDDIHFFDG